MVAAGVDESARGEPEAVDVLDPARERPDELTRDQPVALVERPDRDVGDAPLDELAQRDLGVGVGAHEPGVGGETARLTEVGQHRPLVGAGLEVPAELAEGDDRHLHLAGQDLQVAADLADLELAVLGRAAAAHQLQVVDDDQGELAVAGLEPAGLGADLHHRDPRVVVEEQRHLEPPDGPADLRPVGLAQPAVAHLHRVDPRLAGQDPLGQLVVPHLQREHQHRPSGGLGHVRRHAQPERGVVEEDVGGDEVVEPGDREVDRRGSCRPETMSTTRSHSTSGDAHQRSWSSSSASASSAELLAAEATPTDVPAVGRRPAAAPVDLLPRQSSGRLERLEHVAPGLGRNAVGDAARGSPPRRPCGRGRRRAPGRRCRPRRRTARVTGDRRRRSRSSRRRPRL